MRMMRGGTLPSNKIQVVTGAVIHSNFSSVYLTRRHKPGTAGHGGWHFPGGKLEYGETLRECVVREIREELEVRINPVLQLATRELIRSDSGHQIIMVPYLCTNLNTWPPKPTPATGNSEIVSVDWYDFARLELMEGSVTRAVAEQAFNEIRTGRFLICH